MSTIAERAKALSPDSLGLRFTATDACGRGNTLRWHPWSSSRGDTSYMLDKDPGTGSMTGSIGITQFHITHGEPDALRLVAEHLLAQEAYLIRTPEQAAHIEAEATRLRNLADNIEQTPCEGCGPPFPGVIVAVNGPYGIQRCDECSRFEGDLDAAQVAATAVGGRVHFDGTDGQEHTFLGGELPEGLFIRSGTDPWVEVDGKPVDWTTR